MPKKPGLSLERHYTLGKELFEMTEKLSDIRVELDTAYSEEVYIETVKAHEALKQLRHLLDNLVHKENQGIGEYQRCYYLVGKEHPEPSKK